MLTTAAPTGATISAQDHIMDQPSSWQQGKQGPPKHFGRQHWKNKPAPASVMANGICRDWWAKAQCLNFRNGQACSDSHPEFIQYEGSDQITRMPDTQRCSNYFSKRTCERGDECRWLHEQSHELAQRLYSLCPQDQGMLFVEASETWYHTSEEKQWQWTRMELQSSTTTVTHKPYTREQWQDERENPKGSETARTQRFHDGLQAALEKMPSQWKGSVWTGYRPALDRSLPGNGFDGFPILGQASSSNQTQWKASSSLGASSSFTKPV
jgi:hypothetical protein